MLEFIGYIVVVAISFFGIISVITGFINLPFFFLRLGLISPIIGGAMVWLGVFFLWAILFHEPMPLLLIVLAGILQYNFYPKYWGKNLNQNSRNIMGGESLGFVIISIYYLFKIKDINWY